MKRMNFLPLLAATRTLNIKSLINVYVFPSSYDYENCTTEEGNQVMARIAALADDPEFVGRTYTTNSGMSFKVKSMDNFSYVDPVDNSTATNQASFPSSFFHYL